eukprot:scpid45706/ scgid3587/ Sideroflexin-5; Tricarboxylate carrier BBG-TCC
MRWHPCAQPVSNTDVAVSYVAATGTAGGVAVLLHNAVTSPWFKKFAKRDRRLAKMIPFIAVAAANQVNVLCMRSSELANGVDVHEENGRVVGQSRSCAQTAVVSTMLTRALLPAPILLLPPLILSSMERTALWRNFPAVRFPLHVGVCMSAFAIALPMTIALFPQTLKVETSYCEPEIQLATREEFLYYSRGM